jgi:hypothetical protein
MVINVAFQPKSDSTIDSLGLVWSGSMAEVNLKPGWLIRDVRKASERLHEWQMTKYGRIEESEKKSKPDGYDKKKEEEIA